MPAYFEGTTRFRALMVELDAGLERVPERMDQVVRRAGLEVESTAKTLAPVDTGFLRSSISAEFPSRYKAVVTAHAHYAGFVELGTSRMAPRPYLYPALDRIAPWFERAVAAAADPLA